MENDLEINLYTKVTVFWNYTGCPNGKWSGNQFIYKSNSIYIFEITLVVPMENDLAINLYTKVTVFWNYTGCANGNWSTNQYITIVTVDTHWIELRVSLSEIIPLILYKNCSGATNETTTQY